MAKLNQILLWVIGAVLVIGVRTEAEDVKSLINKASEDYKAGRVEQAFSTLETALELSPGNEAVLHRLCVLYTAAKDYARAETHCLELVKKIPNDPGYRKALYDCRMLRDHKKIADCTTRGDYTCALREALRVVEQYPDIPETQMFAGVMYVYRDASRDDRLRAVAHLREALHLNGRLGGEDPFRLTSEDLAGVHSGLGISYFREEDYTLAEESFESALRIDPSVPDGQANLELAREMKAESEGTRKVVWLSLADILGID